MTTASALLLVDSSTTAAFRAWGSAVSAMLQTCGLVQTADTGQINWSSVAAPAAGLSAGYEIYRFNDALQATKPVFIKVEYMAVPNASGTADAPGLRFAIGTGTNGAGTLTGLVTTGWYIAVSSTNIAFGTYSPCYASGDTSSFVIALNEAYNTANNFSVFFCERTRNLDGTPNGDGVVMGNCWLNGTGNVNVGNIGNSTSQTAYGVINFMTGVMGSTPMWPIAFPGFKWSTENNGTDTPVFPLIVGLPKPEAPVLSVIGHNPGDFVQLTTTSVTINGAAHSYLALGGNCRPVVSVDGQVGDGTGGYGTPMLLMRYE